MKLITLLATVSLGALALPSSSEAQLQLKAPGQPSTLYQASNAFNGAWKNSGAWNDTYQYIGKPYRYTFTGIEAYADADDIPGYYVWGGRNRTWQYSSWGWCVENGFWKFWGTINDDCIGPLYHCTSYAGWPGQSPIQMWWGQAKVYENIDIVAGWHGLSNCRDIDGYWEILGSIEYAPPTPTGELSFDQDLVRADVSPTVSFQVHRGANNAGLTSSVYDTDLFAEIDAQNNSNNNSGNGWGNNNNNGWGNGGRGRGRGNGNGNGNWGNGWRW